MSKKRFKSNRETEFYRNFRRSVLKRDSYSCQYPGCKKRDNLEVHHIKKYSEHHRLRTETFNGITLCSKHHFFITGNEENYESLFFRIVTANSRQPEWEKLDAPKKTRKRKKTGAKNIKRNNLRKRYR